MCVSDLGNIYHSSGYLHESVKKARLAYIQNKLNQSLSGLPEQAQFARGILMKRKRKAPKQMFCTGDQLVNQG